MTTISLMILAFDTSTAACTAALFDGAGECLAHADEVIGRGHAERLVPMLDELLDGRKAERIIVGVGPGSFTGMRVGIAAAHGLAIGWGAELSGMMSLALIAASADYDDSVAVAVMGGHGELFFDEFGEAGKPLSALRSLPPPEAAIRTRSNLVIGSGAKLLVNARGWGEAREALPRAANALKIAPGLRSLPAKPIYARAPDAKAKAA